MPTRNLKFIPGNYYHVFNRGVDKRKIFLDEEDLNFFIRKITSLNRKEKFSLVKNQSHRPIVEINAYALLPNHFHFLVKPIYDGAVSTFMQKLCLSYCSYFNKKYERSGALFEGRFKAKHITGNLSLCNVSVYVNMNNLHHKILDKKLVRTSLDEYLNKKSSKICTIPKIIFEEIKPKDYLQFAKATEQIFIESKMKKKFEH